ncbi:permease [Paenibacillus oleatilyticus]|uniref:permease n=1 Tax=Paenibacillus oleatilyticus TaxID=2594886 RepID=UPI001C1FC495|nr:permease [Paenibacillus oleatilyticus]MBU7314600.1 permease [Paenibacillus oleatilyticus]
MQTIVQRWVTNILAVLCILMLVLIYTQKQPPDLSFLSSAGMQNFKTLFISIILEALPFVLLGVLVSALLQMFVSEQTIRRLTPKNPVLGILFACVVGIIFPLCECGMVPVIRRLVLKGMPVYVAVVFILAGPIINPVVYAATFMAFRTRPEIAYSRMALAFVVAAAIGLIVYRFVKRNPIRGAAGDLSANGYGAHPSGHDAQHSAHEHEHTYKHGHSHEHDHVHMHHHDHTRHHGHTHPHSHADHDHTHDHSHAHSHAAHDHGHSRSSRLLGVLGHASDEFFDMGKYLIFGAFLTALIQTLVARESLVSIGQGDFTSHLFMMGLGYVLSLCSTSDAFVASSFSATFSTGSLLTFLVFGPMLDIKSTLMLLSAFRARFVLLLSALVIIVVLAASLLYERLFFL